MASSMVPSIAYYLKGENGVAVGPLTEDNKRSARLTPAAVGYCDRLAAYLTDLQGNTNFQSANGALQLAPRLLGVLTPEFIGDIGTVLNQGQGTALIISITLAETLRRKLVSGERHGIGAIAGLVIKPSAEEEFQSKYLTLGVCELTLGHTDAVEPENRPLDYQATNYQTFPQSAGAVEFLKGACLAQIIAESTHGPLTSGVTLEGKLLWWNQEFLPSGTQDVMPKTPAMGVALPGLASTPKADKYIIRFKPALKTVLRSAYLDFPLHDATEDKSFRQIASAVGLGNGQYTSEEAHEMAESDYYQDENTVLEARFSNPSFLQAFNSFYQANDPRYQCSSTAGHLKIGPAMLANLRSIEDQRMVVKY